MAFVQSPYMCQTNRYREQAHSYRDPWSIQIPVQASHHSALFDWHELALFDADVFGARADDAVVGALLEHVGRPSGQA